MSPLWLALHLPSAASARPESPGSPGSPESTESLGGLACWAGSFTPRLSLAPPAGLLLEIGGCLRLWGGLDRLLDAVLAGLEVQGHEAALASAPSPQAALWLARCTTHTHCTDIDSMHARLDALPIASIDLDVAAREKLQRFGARTLGDARRLPRDGLARRIGMAAVLTIARAYGEAVDPRPDFVFPENFSQSLELPAAVEVAPTLLFVARRLTAALAGWLAARQAGVAECVLELAHSSRETTYLVLRFAEATRDAQRFERVLRERLERLALAGPVTVLRLAAAAVEPLPGQSGTLFDGAGRAATAMAALSERLRARLGEAGVFRLATHADHRPECATQKVGAGGTAPVVSGRVAATPPRPFWLLDRPEALAEVAGRPYRRGPLRLVSGCERIESGWWDAGEAESFGDIRRDYFVALTPDARWAWVFRELRAPGGWYLHGWFA
ncbi:MAG: DNA polymerase Y family protein [Gammaproteobacteria bacterium]|nr:DNA polymerase Y family protein [Gammaproteobacteria bacterium]MBU1647540.1 DNA polymerase Y family protein [Gammaproteobacteria bacterium]MBU1972989.1 DNA polymerase Y family protein [Gammaproteobacteria bacterium]